MYRIRQNKSNAYKTKNDHIICQNETLKKRVSGYEESEKL